MKTIPKINIAIVDDHRLFREGIANLLTSQNSSQSILHIDIAFHASNGKEFIQQLKTVKDVDIVLLDINMPDMDGFETALWIKVNSPEIKVLALTMYDDTAAIIRMLKNGARGFLTKDLSPDTLIEAIDSIVKKGFYYSEMVTGKLIMSITELEVPSPDLALTENEITFLQYTCTELTYREIAEKMRLSPRTVENYRDSLFEKLGVKSRVALAMYAIKNGFGKI